MTQISEGWRPSFSCLYTTRPPAPLAPTFAISGKTNKKSVCLWELAGETIFSDSKFSLNPYSLLNVKTAPLTGNIYLALITGQALG